MVVKQSRHSLAGVRMF